MIFLKYDESGRVNYRHYEPEKLPNEFKETGLLVETMPQPEYRDGYEPILYVDTLNNQPFYKYEFRMSQEIALLKDTIFKLQEDNANLVTLLVEGGVI